MLQSLGFDPWLWCRSAQYSSGKCSGEVFLSPWFRLTPVLLAQSKMRSLQAAGAVQALGSPAAVTSQPPLPHCLFPLPGDPLRQGDWRKIFWEDCQKKMVCSPHCLKLGFSSGVLFSTQFFVLNEQPFCKLHSSFNWEQGFCLAEILW